MLPPPRQSRDQPGNGSKKYLKIRIQHFILSPEAYNQLVQERGNFLSIGKR